MTGSNSCVAGDVIATIHTEILDRTLVIYPVLLKTATDHPRICPMIYLPVIESVFVIVPLGSRLLFDAVMVRNAYEFGALLPLAWYHNEKAPTLHDLTEKASILTNVTATPINGGINPAFAGLRIAADAEVVGVLPSKVVLRETMIAGQRFVYGQQYNVVRRLTVRDEVQHSTLLTPVSLDLISDRSLGQIGIVNVDTRGNVVKIADLQQ